MIKNELVNHRNEKELLRQHLSGKKGLRSASSQYPGQAPGRGADDALHSQKAARSQEHLDQQSCSK